MNVPDKLPDDIAELKAIIRNRSIETANYFWSMGAIKMIAIPARQKIAPMISHRVGI